MSKGRRIDLGRSATDGLDLVSYGRGGPRTPFSPRQIEQLRLTVHRAPEVMVKVSGGGRDAGGVAAHVRYLDRKGELAIETDDGRVLMGEGAAQALVEDWNLDVERSAGPVRAGERPAPKQAHNIVLSMPRRTDPDKLLDAARGFAERQFGDRHRYAMVLHTDQDHPHVHLVVKAVSVEGERLYVRKATLREWRSDFAEELRARGIAANATPRSIRGATRTPESDGLYRSRTESRSTYDRDRAEQVRKEIEAGALTPGPGKQRLVESRRAVLAGWQVAAEQLRSQGEARLASDVERFAGSLPPPRTAKERVAAELLAGGATRESGARQQAPRARSR
jgi:Relaxase/Mobilisation nuclease domain